MRFVTILLRFFLEFSMNAKQYSVNDPWRFSFDRKIACRRRASLILCVHVSLKIQYRVHALTADFLSVKTVKTHILMTLFFILWARSLLSSFLLFAKIGSTYIGEPRLFIKWVLILLKQFWNYCQPRYD